MKCICGEWKPYMFTSGSRQKVSVYLRLNFWVFLKINDPFNNLHLRELAGFCAPLQTVPVSLSRSSVQDSTWTQHIKIENTRQSFKEKNEILQTNRETERKVDT